MGPWSLEPLTVGTDEEKVRAFINDGNRFMRKLAIIDAYGKLRYLEDPWEEQVALWHALFVSNRVFVLKCRQVGITTAVIAFFLWKYYRQPDPKALLSIGHEEGAKMRMNTGIRTHYENLPPGLKPSLPRDNQSEIQSGHNGAIMRQLVAGGRGQAKSFTYNDLHATEMAYWPEGSSAAKGGNVARTLWASVRATMHDPDGHVVVESTADGPSGLFYDMYKRAVLPGSDWHFLFFPWHHVARYRRPVEDPERFAEEMTDEELELVALYGLDLEQVAFRRHKLEDDLYSPMRFRREYPLNPLEPFLLTGDGWFNLEQLNRYAAALPPGQQNDTKQLHLYLKPTPGRRYFIGMDTSGGTGGDFAVITVVRDDLKMAARWASNRHSPKKQADMLAKISSMYLRALSLVEENNHGKTVIKHAKTLGVNLWTDPKEKKVKYFFATTALKREYYDWARYIADSDYCEISCATTVKELTTIVEKSNGKIEADGDGHDDHADAWALAVFCARRYWSPDGNLGKARMDQLKKRARDILGVRA